MTALYAFGTLLAVAGVLAVVRRHLAKRQSRQSVHLDLGGK
ncbi:MAG: hypothetical protein ACE5MH_05350 [Terriglobia bacterium]